MNITPTAPRLPFFLCLSFPHFASPSGTRLARGGRKEGEGEELLKWVTCTMSFLQSRATDCCLGEARCDSRIVPRPTRTMEERWEEKTFTETHFSSLGELNKILINLHHDLSSTLVFTPFLPLSSRHTMHGAWRRENTVQLLKISTPSNVAISPPTRGPGRGDEPLATRILKTWSPS